MSHHHCNVCEAHCGRDDCKEIYFGVPGGFILRDPKPGGQWQAFVCHECLRRFREILPPAEEASAEEGAKEHADES